MTVMAGLVPAIQMRAPLRKIAATTLRTLRIRGRLWIPGTSPGMTFRN